MKGSGQNWVLHLQWATSLFFSVGFAHPDPLWIPFKEVAVTLIYQMAEGPDVICAQILQGCAKQALEKLEEKSTPQDDPKETPVLSTFLLMNLLSLAGDVALQQLVHLEQAVSGELCRRRVLREEQEHKTKEPKETNTAKVYRSKGKERIAHRENSRSAQGLFQTFS